MVAWIRILQNRVSLNRGFIFVVSFILSTGVRF